MADVTVKVSDLIGDALDQVVAFAQGWTTYVGETTKGTIYRTHEDTVIPVDKYHPSTNWEQGGAIIDLHIGNIWKHNKLDIYEPDVWSAAIYTRSPEGGVIYSLDGPTALVAAMRSFCFSRVGESIKVPEELL